MMAITTPSPYVQHTWPEPPPDSPKRSQQRKISAQPARRPLPVPRPEHDQDTTHDHSSSSSPAAPSPTQCAVKYASAQPPSSRECLLSTAAPSPSRDLTEGHSLVALLLLIFMHVRLYRLSLEASPPTSHTPVYLSLTATRSHQVGQINTSNVPRNIAMVIPLPRSLSFFMSHRVASCR